LSKIEFGLSPLLWRVDWRSYAALDYLPVERGELQKMCRETKLEGKNNNWYDQGVEMTFQSLILAIKCHHNQKSEVH
jgi:hypothetical protein